MPYSMCNTIPCIMYDSGPSSPTYFAHSAAVGGGESSPSPIMNIVMTIVATSPPTNPLSMLTMCIVLFRNGLRVTSGNPVSVGE